MCWGRDSSSDSNDDEESAGVLPFQPCLRIKNGTLTKNHVDSHSGITQQHIPIVHSLHGTSFQNNLEHTLLSFQLIFIISLFLSLQHYELCL